MILAFSGFVGFIPSDDTLKDVPSRDWLVKVVEIGSLEGT